MVWGTISQCFVGSLSCVLPNLVSVFYSLILYNLLKVSSPGKTFKGTTLLFFILFQPFLSDEYVALTISLRYYDLVYKTTLLSFHLERTTESKKREVLIQRNVENCFKKWENRSKKCERLTLSKWEALNRKNWKEWVKKMEQTQYKNGKGLKVNQDQSNTLYCHIDTSRPFNERKNPLS